MPELAAGFQSLPPEYQRIIRLAQDQHHLTATLLSAALDEAAFAAAWRQGRCVNLDQALRFADAGLTTPA